MKKIITRNQMSDVAREILAHQKKIWTLTGTLGAGKTTLVQEMLATLGVTGPVQSPTYTYVSVYQLADGRRVYHFDLYRLSSYEHFIQAGFDEYLHDPQGICFIEWPEIVLPYLFESVGHIVLEYGEGENRVITFTQ